MSQASHGSAARLAETALQFSREDDLSIDQSTGRSGHKRALTGAV